MGVNHGVDSVKIFLDNDVGYVKLSSNKLSDRPETLSKSYSEFKKKI